MSHRINADVAVDGVVTVNGDSPWPPRASFTASTSDTAVSAATETAIAGLTDLEFPSVPDGIKKFAVTVCATVVSGTGLPRFRIRLGETGTTSDTLAYVVRTQADPSELEGRALPRLEVTPSQGDKLSLFSISPTNGHTVGGGDTNNRHTWVLIEEIIEG